MLGRHERDNDIMARLALPDDIFVTPLNVPGPSALIRGGATPAAILPEVYRLILCRINQPVPDPVTFTVVRQGVERTETVAPVASQPTHTVSPDPAPQDLSQ